MICSKYQGILKIFLYSPKLLIKRNIASTTRILSSSKSSSSKYDYIICGSGSAGCVIANRLSENPNNKVLLIEAGKSSDYYVWFHIPVGYLYCINNPRADWCFKTSLEDGLNGRELIYPRGLGLGGCSLINGVFGLLIFSLIFVIFISSFINLF
jgi:hypothetical protein